ncbi:MAG: Maf family protein [Patescibacteria group bacterium]
MQLILGSQSWGRKKVLKSAGYEFEVAPADIDEKSIRDNDPYALTDKIARAKADALKDAFPSHILITGDTVGYCNDEILEKPTSEEEYRRNIEWTQKMPLQFISSVVVTDTKNNIQLSAVDTATVTYSNIPDDVLEKVIAKGVYGRYAAGIATEEPLLLPFITVIGEKSTAMGLPLKEFKELLNKVI